jgi:hypothetical protein
VNLRVEEVVATTMAVSMVNLYPLKIFSITSFSGQICLEEVAKGVDHSSNISKDNNNIEINVTRTKILGRQLSANLDLSDFSFCYLW